MRAWFSGKTSAFQAEAAGSIPAARFQNKLFFAPYSSSEMINKEPAIITGKPAEIKNLNRKKPNCVATKPVPASPSP